MKMVTLISRGKHRCTAICYNAKHPKCICQACGGVNHSVGFEKAIENTQKIENSSEKGFQISMQPLLKPPIERKVYSRW